MMIMMDMSHRKTKSNVAEMQLFLDPLTPWPTLCYFLSPHSLACVTMTEKQTSKAHIGKA